MSLRVGSRVMAVSDFGGGWGDVKKGDIGVITRVDGSMYVADFPHQEAWHGLATDFKELSGRTSKTKKLKVPKVPKIPKCNKVFVSAQVHNQIVKDAKKHKKNNMYYAYEYILGADKHNIIRKIVRLRGSGGGCNMMGAVTASAMAKGLGKVLESKLIAIGMLRIGYECLSGDYLYQVTAMADNAILLSYDTQDECVEGERERDGESVYLEYNVVP